MDPTPFVPLVPFLLSMFAVIVFHGIALFRMCQFDKALRDMERRLAEVEAAFMEDGPPDPDDGEPAGDGAGDVVALLWRAA